MEIKTKGNTFWAVARYEEKDALKQAGFFWHGGNCRPNCGACAAGLGKVWWTPFADKARKLANYADAPAKAALQPSIQAVESSRALDAPTVEIPCPEGQEYRGFQKAGIAYALSRPSTLIGDEMGVGKTIQAIGVINATNPKNVLIIVPASLRLNWKRELEKWLVTPRDILVVDKPKMDLSTASTVVINYDRLRNGYGKQLMERSWDLIIADEAHLCKNPKAQRTKLVLGAYNHKTKTKTPGLVDKAARKIFLTGTPILNRPIEIQPIAGALSPSNFGNFFTFGKRYAGAYQDKYGWHFDGATNLSELQDRLRATIMIRRLKKDVLAELPPKQRAIRVLSETSDTDDFSGFDDAFADAQVAEASGDPAAYAAAVAKLDSKCQIAFEEMSSSRHAQAVEKIPMVLEHCDSVLESQDKIVVFAHHSDGIDALAAHYGSAAVVVDGRTPNDARQAAVDAFQTNAECKVFIGSIKAAGVGLTLTASSHVIFAELDWVPGNVTQAEDRCHRMGQQDHVLVEHLVVDGTIDARLAAVLVWKQAILDVALDTQAAPIVVPEGIARRPVARKYPEATQAQQEACKHALAILAGMCDGARTEDGVGFNRMDTSIGRKLATLPELSDGQVALCKKMLPKYHRQIGDTLVQQILGKVA